MEDRARYVHNGRQNPLGQDWYDGRQTSLIMMVGNEMLIELEEYADGLFL